MDIISCYWFFAGNGLKLNFVTRASPLCSASEEKYNH